MSSFDEKIENLLQQSAVQYIIYKKNEDTERMEKLHLFARKLLQRNMLLDLLVIFQQGNPVRSMRYQVKTY